MMGNLYRWALVAIVIAGCNGSDPPGGAGMAGTGAVGGTGGSGAAGSGAVGGTSGSGGGGNCPTGIAFNPGTDPNRNMVTADQVCERLAAIQCAAERCCCADGNARKYASEQECITSQTNICMQIDTETVSTDNRSGFNASKLNAAFAEFEQLAASCDLGIVNWGTSQDGFAGVLEGTVAVGGTCWTPFVDLADPAAIASCGGVNACLGDAVSVTPWKCAARRGAGASCLVDPSCEESLFCDGAPVPPSTTLGTCAARLADGATCERATQCQSLFCVNHQCVPPSAEAAYCLKP